MYAQFQKFLSDTFGRTYSGPVGAVRMSVMAFESPQAAEMSKFLPWLLREELSSPNSDQEKLVCGAILTPAVHEALEPLLHDIMAAYVNTSESARHFMFPARHIARSGNRKFHEIALPLFPEALKRESWSAHNWGTLACDFLDMGGNPDDLLPSLQNILSSQTDDDGDKFYRQNKETKLAKHLCEEGWIKFLNHPRVKESKTLEQALKHYAGEIINIISEPMFRENLSVMACVQEKRIGLVWKQGYDCARYTPLNNMRELGCDFLSATIATTAMGLFNQMSSSDNREIRNAAGQALDRLRNEFYGDNKQLAQFAVK